MNVGLQGLCDAGNEWIPWSDWGRWVGTNRLPHLLFCTGKAVAPQMVGCSPEGSWSVVLSGQHTLCILQALALSQPITALGILCRRCHIASIPA
jgi:hypothetical protein